MAANISQAILEAAGVSSMVDELAAGNFSEGRESLQDYIYSRFMLSEGKGHSSNTASSGAPVFPNSDLAGSYPNTLPAVDSSYQNTENLSEIESEGSRAVKASGSQPSVKTDTPEKPVGPRKRPGLVEHGIKHERAHAGKAEGMVTKVKKKTYPKKKDKTNMCGVCGRGFAEKYTLNRHMLTHTRVKPYSCSKCSMSFSRSDGLAKHMAAGHRRTDAHHCDVCGGTFNSQVSYEQHRREYGSTLPFVCNLCMLAFSQCCHLNYHMKSHALSKLNDAFCFNGQEDKPIDVSELVPDDFSPQKKDLLSADLLENRHDSTVDLLDPNIVIKPEIEDFPTCSSINSQIPRSSLGRAALNAFSSTAQKQDLGKLSASQPESSHTANNSASNPPGSSRSLSLSSSDEVELVSDAEIKKYFNIKVPNPKFVEAYELLMSPAGEDGLFRCGICGKGFTRKYHMQRHVKLHLRGPIPRAHLLDWTRRPYACGVCKMGFTRQHHLTRHMLIHTGERPHSCHICSKAFRRITNLSLHIRTVHGAERPFRCHICERGFPRLYSLQRHLKLHAKKSSTLVCGASSENKDQTQKGFKVVGTIDMQHSSQNAGEPKNTQQLPGDGQKIYNSGVASHNEINKHDARLENESGSQVINQNEYTHMMEGAPVYVDHTKQGQIMEQMKQQGQIMDQMKQQGQIMEQMKQGQIMEQMKQGQIMEQMKQQSQIMEQIKQHSQILDQMKQHRQIIDQMKQQGQIIDHVKQQNQILEQIKQQSQILEQLKQQSHSMSQIIIGSHSGQVFDRQTISQAGDTMPGSYAGQIIDRQTGSLQGPVVDRPTSVPSIQADRPLSSLSGPSDRLAGFQFVQVVDRPPSSHSGLVDRSNSSHFIQTVDRPPSSHSGQVVDRTTSSHFVQVADRPPSSHSGQIVDRSSNSHFIQNIDRPSSHSGLVVDRTTSSLSGQVVDRPNTSQFVHIIDRPPSSHSGQVVDRTANSLSGQVVDRSTGSHFIQVVDRPASTQSVQLVDRPTTSHFVQVLERPASTVSGQTIDRIQSSHANQPQSMDRPGLANQHSSPSSDDRTQQKFLISTSGEIVKIQNPLLPLQANNVQQSVNSSDMRSHIPIQAINAVEFGLQLSLQNIVEGRLLSADGASKSVMVATSGPIGGNFSEQEVRDTSGYTTNQRRGSADGFVVPQRQIQSPHPVVNSTERPGSRSMVTNQSGGQVVYHQATVGYSQPQASSQLTQHASMNLPVTLITVNPANMQDVGNYSHSHQINSHGGISNSAAAYSYTHSINNLTFPVGHHDIYHQQVADNNADIQQSSNGASPLPVTSHNNNMQY